MSRLRWRTVGHVDRDGTGHRAELRGVAHQLATFALQISFLLGRQLMFGQEPPIHRRSTTAVRRPDRARCQARSLPPRHCRGSGFQTVPVEACACPCAACPCAACPCAACPCAACPCAACPCAACPCAACPCAACPCAACPCAACPCAACPCAACPCAACPCAACPCAGSQQEAPVQRRQRPHASGFAAIAPSRAILRQSSLYRHSSPTHKVLMTLPGCRARRFLSQILRGPREGWDGCSVEINSRQTLGIY